MSSAYDRYVHSIYQSKENAITVTFYMTYSDALKRKDRLVGFDFDSMKEAFVFFIKSPGILRTLKSLCPDGAKNDEGVHVVCDDRTLLCANAQP